MTETISTQLSEKKKHQVIRAADLLGITKSEFLRKALQEKMDSLNPDLLEDLAELHRIKARIEEKRADFAEEVEERKKAEDFKKNPLQGIIASYNAKDREGAQDLLDPLEPHVRKNIEGKLEREYPLIRSWLQKVDVHPTPERER